MRNFWPAILGNLGSPGDIALRSPKYRSYQVDTRWSNRSLPERLRVQSGLKQFAQHSVVNVSIGWASALHSPSKSLRWCSDMAL